MFTRVASIAVVGSLAISVAASTPQTRVDPARLGTDLTPVGAERAANAAGTIPAYAGGLAKKAIDPAVGYADPYAEDRPLYTITAANMTQYAQFLSTGSQTLLKRDVKNHWRMNVYPTRRSAAYPADVLATVKTEAGKASIDGYHIRNVGKTTVPFPMPTDPLQVMWNHVFRWRGGSFERQWVSAPVAPSGAFYLLKVHLNVAFDQQGYVEDPQPDLLYRGNQYFMSPTPAIGTKQLQFQPIDPAADPPVRWVYTPQNDDVRRLPAYDYDTLEAFTGGLRTSDQNDGWNGAPDRYTWKLVGKRELIIGYNAYRIADRALKYKDIIRARNLDPDLMRYELHRVWVVEATRRIRHTYFKRIFYVDEDTWQVAQEEIYNEAGKLVRFGDHQMMQFYDVMVPWYAATIHHDINTASYLVSYLDNQEPLPLRWGFKGRTAEFVPNSLRTLGIK